MQATFSFKRAEKLQYVASIKQCFTAFKVELLYFVYYNTSLLSGQNLSRRNRNFINIPVKIHIKPQYDSTHSINQSSTTRIVHNPLLLSLEVPPFIHQVSSSTYGSVSRRRRWRWQRSSLVQCFLGGRSGKEGGRSEGSSGDPPRHSAPSYIPGQQKRRNKDETYLLKGCMSLNRRVERRDWFLPCIRLTSNQ